MESDKPASSGINMTPEQLKQALEQDAAIRTGHAAVAEPLPSADASAIDRAAYYDHHAAGAPRGRCGFCATLEQLVDGRCRDCFAGDYCIGCAMFLMGKQPAGCVVHAKSPTMGSARMVEEARIKHAAATSAAEQAKVTRAQQMGEASGVAQLLHETHRGLFGGKEWAKLSDSDRSMRAAWAVDVLSQLGPMLAASTGGAAPSNVPPAVSATTAVAIRERVSSALLNSMTAAHNLALVAGEKPKAGDDMQQRVYIADAVHVLSQAAQLQVSVLERVRLMIAADELTRAISPTGDAREPMGMEATRG